MAAIKETMPLSPHTMPHLPPQSALTLPELDAPSLPLSAATLPVGVLPSGYAAHLRRVQQSCPDWPRVDLFFRDLTYTLPAATPSSSRTAAGTAAAKPPTLLTALPRAFDALREQYHASRSSNNNSATRMHALAPSSGRIAAGSMTLILAPPGHGKSLLLKALSARLNDDSNLSGEIQWGGVNAKEAARRGLQLKRLCAYCEQVDNAFPMLTTRETMQFAVETATASEDLLPSEQPASPPSSMADELLALTGLSACADTLVGGGSGIRGISGGQRRRACLTEVLATQARVLCADEITTGLDSQSALDIVSALGAWARLTGGTVVMALLQPAPEVIAQFDSVILLREGHVVFHGPRAELDPYVRDTLGLQVPDDQDLGDFVTALLTDPARAQRQAAVHIKEHNKFVARRKSASSAQRTAAEEEEEEEERLSVVGSAVPSVVRFHLEAPSPAQPAALATAKPLAALPRDDSFRLGASPAQQLQQHQLSPKLSPVALDTAALVRIWRSSPWSSLHAEADADDGAGVTAQHTLQRGARMPRAQIDSFRASLTPYTRAQFYSPRPRSLLHYLRVLFWRESRIFVRSSSVHLPRLAKDVGYGLVAGSLFYGRASDSYSATALAFIASSALSFSNMSEVSPACQARQVISAQLDGQTYSSSAYVAAQAMVHIPLSVFETFVFALPVYFLAGFVLDAGRFFFFFLVLLLFNEQMSAMFKAVAYAARSPSVGQVLVEPMVVLWQSCSGFLIAPSAIPAFLYWISPFSWSIRSIAQNEFLSPRYDDLLGTPPQQQRRGDLLLQTWQITTDKDYMWAGVGMLFGEYLVLSALAAWLLSGKRQWLAMGTKRATAPHAALGAGVGAGRGGGVEMTQLVPRHAAAPAPSPSPSPVPEDALIERREFTTPAAHVSVNAAAVLASPSPPPSASSSLVHSHSAASSSSHSSVMPFVRRSLQWRNVCYFVKADKTKSVKQESATASAIDGAVPASSAPGSVVSNMPREKQLLRNVDGMCAAGSLTALMGSSGAGKTSQLRSWKEAEARHYIGHPRSPFLRSVCFFSVSLFLYVVCSLVGRSCPSYRRRSLEWRHPRQRGKHS
jgi:ABC-type multidrug transport system ATPase subunit